MNIKNKDIQAMVLGIYQHSSGKLYQVIGVCRHSETLEIMVVYQQLYGDYGLWVRPIDMFNGNVEIDGVVKQRFAFIKETVTKEPSLR